MHVISKIKLQKFWILETKKLGKSN